MSAINTINLGPIDETRQAFEAIVTGTPKPGYLVELASDRTVQVHGTSGGVTEKMFMREDQGGAKTINDAYIGGETGRFMRAWGGDRVLGYLADAQTVVANVTKLISNGDGTLIVAAGTEIDGQIVGVATESLTSSGITAIKLRVL